MDKLKYLLDLRHLFAYDVAKGIIPEGSKVLDLGCNEGYGTYELFKNFDVVGLDVDKKLVDKAIESYGQMFMIYDGKCIPFDDGSFDAVVSFQVIEHVEDVPGFLSEVRRVLKPKGIFLCSTPCRVYRLLPGQKPWNQEHLREYDSKEFLDTLKGFEVVIKGVRGVGEVHQFELDRVRPFKLAGRDRFNLRRFVPGFVKKWFIRRSFEPAEDLSKYSLRDYELTDHDVDLCLDLFAICEKPLISDKSGN